MPVERILHFGLTRQQFIEIGIGFGKSGIYLLELVQQIDYRLNALLHHFLHRFVLVEFRILLQITHCVAGRKYNFAFVRLVDAGYYLHQRRFSGAIQTDDTDFGTIEKRQINVFQNFTLWWNRFADFHHRKNHFLIIHTSKN